MDDFKNVCECEEYPLLRTINRVLRKYPGPHNNCILENRKAMPMPDTTKKPVTTKKPMTTAVTTTTQRVTKRPTTTEEPAVDTTTKRRETTRRTSTTTKEPMIEEDEYVDLPELDDDFSCNEGRLFAHHKTNCSIYYQCDNGKPIERV